MAEKHTKAETDYSRGMIHSHCGPCFKDDRGYCQHYHGKPAPDTGRCEVVEGEIDPIMWCRLFKKAK